MVAPVPEYYPFIGVSGNDYSPQSDHFINQYTTTTHLPYIYISLYYYYIRHKLTGYYQIIQYFNV